MDQKIILHAAICGKADILERIAQAELEIAALNQELKFFRQKLIDYDIIIKEYT